MASSGSEEHLCNICGKSYPNAFADHKMHCQSKVSGENAAGQDMPMSVYEVLAARSLLLLRCDERNLASVDHNEDTASSGAEVSSNAQGGSCLSCPYVPKRPRACLQPEEELDCLENYAAMELKRSKIDQKVPHFAQEQNEEPDLKVPDDSVVMQERKQKIDASAAVLSDSSDDDIRDVIDDQTK